MVLKNTGGTILASSHTPAAGTGEDTPSAAIQQQHATNHYHKFLVGPLEIDTNINDERQVV